MNLNEVCRLCLLTNDNKYPLFQVRMTALSSTTPTDADTNAERSYVFEYLQKISSVKLNPNDGLPSLICVDCLNEVSNIYTFRNRCVNAQNRMQPLIDSQIPFNYHEVCRTCTNSNGTLESLESGLVFNGRAITLLQVINKFFSLTLAIKTGAPDKICNACLQRVQRAISFRRSCEQCDVTIKMIRSEPSQKNQQIITAKMIKKRKKNNDNSDAMTRAIVDDNYAGELLIQAINRSSNVNTSKTMGDQPHCNLLSSLIPVKPILANDDHRAAESRVSHSNSSIMQGTNGSCNVGSRPVNIKLITEEKASNVRKEPYSKSPPPLVSLEPIVIHDDPHDAVEWKQNNPNTSIMMALNEINMVNSRPSTVKLITNEEMQQISDALVQKPLSKSAPDKIPEEIFVIEDDDNAARSSPAANHLEEILIDDDDSVEPIENISNRSNMLGIKEEPELEIIDVDIQNDYFNLLNAWPEEKNNLETILLDDEEECSNSTQPVLESQSEIVAPNECTSQVAATTVEVTPEIKKPQIVTESIPVEKSCDVDLFQISESGLTALESSDSTEVDFDQQIIANVIVKQI